MKWRLEIYGRLKSGGRWSGPLLHLIVVLACSLAVQARAADDSAVDLDPGEDKPSIPASIQKGSWVAAPIPISNPTVGTGLQGVLLYLHPKADKASNIPNTTSGLGGMYTDNKSWAVGAFHDGNWADDTYRYRVFMGAGDFNLKFYGIGDDPIFSDNPISYRMRVEGMGGRLLRRLPGTQHWYAGVEYLFSSTELIFSPSNLNLDLPDLAATIRAAGLGLVASYDSTDDNYYPQHGRLFQLKWTDYGKHWGGDFEYAKLSTFYNHYLPLWSDTTLALRANLQTSSGDTPYFALPYLDMRGFARDRYRDINTFSLHAEARHKFSSRWGFVLFTASGWHAEEMSRLVKGDAVTSYGVGLRWQVAADKKMHLGVDIAFNKGENVTYVRLGEKF